MQGTDTVHPSQVLAKELGLSTRTLVRLAREHSRQQRMEVQEAMVRMTLADVARMEGDLLMDLHGFGRKSLAELRQVLGARGLFLADDRPDHVS